MSNITYEPHGVPDIFSLGNGVTENIDYNNRLQPTQIRAVEGAELLKLNFVYNPTGQSTKNNGNIHEQKITVTGLPSGFVTQQYTYDKVNRITQVTEGGWSRSYHYDAFGNRAMQGSVPSPAKAPLCVLDGVLGCSNTDPDVADRPAYDAATNRFNSDWAKYDAAGNVLWHKDPVGSATRQWSAAYDALNKQIYYCDGGIDPCTSGAATGRYSYDGAGNRVEKVVGSTTTTYVYDASGRLAAEYSNQAPTGAAKTLFRTVDHLGSTRLVTDANGDVVSRRDFFPFGEEIAANGTFGNRQLVLDGQGTTTYNASTSFAQKFTAKERDDESGLDYFEARYQSSAIGRFSSPDPISFNILRVVSPQRWNRYAYAVNNPLQFVDPDGRDAISVNFSQAAVGMGHQGIMVVRQDGSATYGDFGPVNPGRPIDRGEFLVRDLTTKVDFDSSGLPTEESLQRMVDEVAQFKSDDSPNISFAYFKTSTAETQALSAYLDNADRRQQAGDVPPYIVSFSDCSGFCSQGLRAAGIGDGARVATIPNISQFFAVQASDATFSGKTGRRQVNRRGSKEEVSSSFIPCSPETANSEACRGAAQ